MVLRSNELDFLILQNGKDGTPANSKYTWVKYSQSADGSGLTDDPTNAIYIGIAYNKDSEIESEDPVDYSWSKIKGDKGDTGQDAYSIILENDHVSFVVSNNNVVLSNQSFSCQILVFQGTTPRTDFTIGDIDTESYIHVTKQERTIIISATNGETFVANSGNVSIPISIDGLTFYKNLSWNVAKQGKPGQVGESSTNVILFNESQNILSDGGYVVNTLELSVPFVAFKGTAQVPATVAIESLPSGMTLVSNTPSTATKNGEIKLGVSKGASLGGSAITSGYINLLFSVSGLSIPKRFLWNKIENGNDGDSYDLELSNIIISKDYNGILDPPSITLKAFQTTGEGRVPYAGRFIISQCYSGEILVDESNKILTDENGDALHIATSAISEYEVVYTSSQNESEYTYNIDIDNVSSIICRLCEAGSTTKTLDQQTITVLSNYDQIKPIIEEITTTLSGVASEVDAVQNQITNKVWQADITTQINNYDNSTIKTIRDQISQQTITIDGIESTVSDIESEFSSTTQTLSQRITQAQQTADKFSWLVKSNSSSSSLTLTDAAITAVSQQSIFKSPDGSATVIEGGRLKANSITADMIATGAITIGKFDSTTQGLINGAAKKIYHSTAGTSGTPGYFLLCTLKITQQYMNQPIIITVLNRGKMPSTVWIAFQNDAGTDPALNFIKKTGDANFYIVKLATSTWQLYVQKSESYDNLSVTDFQVGSYASKITVTWETTQVSTLPTGYTTAIQMVGSSTWCYNNDLTYIDGGKIYTGTVTANQIAANAITSDKIAANAITSGKIAANAITAEKITSGAITADKIATNAITSGKIAADAVTADKLNVSSLSAISANLGTITAGSINIGSGKFTVSSSGVLTATGATISGVITATSGKIGGFTLSSALYSGSHSTFASTADGVYMGTDGFSVGSDFKVTNAGKLTANYVSINGLAVYRALDINVTDSGSIRFNGTPLDSPNANDEWSNVIRLPSGTMIVTTWTQHQVSISTPWGSGYISQQLSGASYGISFKNKPLEFFMASPVSTTTANVCSVMPMYNGTTSTCSSFYLFAPGTITNMQWFIKVIAIGRWK